MTCSLNWFSVVATALALHLALEYRVEWSVLDFVPATRVIAFHTSVIHGVLEFQEDEAYIYAGLPFSCSIA